MNVEHLKLIKTIESNDPISDNSDECVISSDKKYISLSGNKHVLLYNVSNGNVIYIDHNVNHWDMFFSSDCNLLIYLSNDTLYSFDIQNRKECEIMKNCCCLYVDKNIVVCQYLNETTYQLILCDFFGENSKSIIIPIRPTKIGVIGNQLYVTNQSKDIIQIDLNSWSITPTIYPPRKNLKYCKNYWNCIFYKDKILYESHDYNHSFIELHDITTHKTYFKDLSVDNKQHLGGFIIRGLKCINDYMVVFAGDCGSVNLWNFITNQIISMITGGIVYDVTVIDSHHIAFINNNKLYIWDIYKTDIELGYLSNDLLMREGIFCTEHCYTLDSDTLITNLASKSISIWKINRQQ